MAEINTEAVPKATDLMEEVRLTFAPGMDLLQAIETGPDWRPRLPDARAFFRASCSMMFRISP